ncbi:MAG: hypothetical protein FHOMOCKG_00107 [Methanophagales virus GBV302]|uniref:Calcineurin-like phosphoesterase domain-containing protein n=1 Tax=Methanophagales virus GBV302 TaxID=2999281 RepID=A0A9E8V943_9CAUD|nr:MAG: hypothetical protein QIT37_gp107 [Methanophagales virus GBV302]WAE39635.1 MAG: hypothetical protein FHOMOCKG_00107 [Methanophagales virus GBV302]
MKVVLNGDWHIGQGEFSPETIAEITKRYWNGKKVILMGDLIDCGLSGGMQFENEIQPQSQLRWVKIITEKLDVVAYCLGNHEYRIFNEVGLNVYEEYLGKPSHRVEIDGVDFYFAHGRSAATDIFIEHRKLLQYTDADVIALGHNHTLAKLDVLRGDKRITLLRTGSLARGLRYAIDRSLPPTLTGWVEYDTRKRAAKLMMVDKDGEVREI